MVVAAIVALACSLSLTACDSGGDKKAAKPKTPPTTAPPTDFLRMGPGGTLIANGPMTVGATTIPGNIKVYLNGIATRRRLR